MHVFADGRRDDVNKDLGLECLGMPAALPHHQSSAARESAGEIFKTGN
jgi:hypothetical protein